MKGNELRQECRVIKALYNISYKEIAEKLGIKQDSLYAWLRGMYEFSDERSKQLTNLLNELKK